MGEQSTSGFEDHHGKRHETILSSSSNVGLLCQRTVVKPDTKENAGTTNPAREYLSSSSNVGLFMKIQHARPDRNETAGSGGPARKYRSSFTVGI